MNITIITGEHGSGKTSLLKLNNYLAGKDTVFIDAGMILNKNKDLYLLHENKNNIVVDDCNFNTMIKLIELKKFLIEKKYYRKPYEKEMSGFFNPDQYNYFFIFQDDSYKKFIRILKKYNSRIFEDTTVINISRLQLD
jgi:predicted ATP-binding protein involved in virulence